MAYRTAPIIMSGPGQRSLISSRYGARVFASPAAPAPPGTRVSPRVRDALDVVRALAACYVVAHHVAEAHTLPGRLALAFKFGQEAVLVFFLLSGFVIFANERDRAGDWRAYAWRRIRRIYPPLLFAMLVSSCVIAASGQWAALFSWRGLFGTLLALQDVAKLKPGVITDPYLLNYPLWSLSYELAFYAAFPLVMIAWRRWPLMTNVAVGASSCAAYALYVMQPNHFLLVGAYFLIWWSGAMVAAAYQRGARSIRAMPVTIGFLALLGTIAIIVTWRSGFTGRFDYPALMARHFLFALAIVVIGFGPMGRALVTLLQRGGIRLTGVAAISYGLYVLHYPLLVQSPLARTPLGFTVSLALLVLLAWWIERWLPLAWRAPGHAPGRRGAEAAG